jgi:hypothetical protein
MPLFLGPRKGQGGECLGSLKLEDVAVFGVGLSGETKLGRARAPGIRILTAHPFGFGKMK